MPKLLFIGESAEAYPFTLLGIETIAPAAVAGGADWMEEAAHGDYSVIMISEGLFRSMPEAVGELARRLQSRAALTIIPDPARPKSEHLHFLRLSTVRALGIDTWNAPADVTAGEYP